MSRRIVFSGSTLIQDLNGAANIYPLTWPLDLAARVRGSCVPAVEWRHGTKNTHCDLNAQYLDRHNQLRKSEPSALSDGNNYFVKPFDGTAICAWLTDQTG